MNKKLISMLLAVLMVVSMFSGMTVSAYADNQVDASLFTEHVMNKGDTVLKVCQSLGINYYTCKAAIMKMNGFVSDTDFRFISVGKSVYFPVSNDAAAKIAAVGTSTGTGTTGTTTGTTVSGSDSVAYYLVPHTMSKGETVYSVCQAMGINYGTYSEQIQKLNNLSSLSNVKAGQTLVFPTGSKPAVGVSCYAVMAHKVASNETAYTICSDKGISYGGSLKTLQAVNNTNNLNYIKAGSTFYVPVPTVISAAASTGTTTGTNTSAGVTPTTAPTPAAKTYALNVNVASGGVLNFYVNNKAVNAAAAGDIVTIVATPNSGYALNTIEVMFTDGSATPKLTGNTFVMPSNEVTTTATFIKGYDITVDCKYTNGLKVMINGLSASSAAAGAKVQVASNNSSLSIDGKVDIYNTATGKFWKSIDPGMTFDMPEFAVTVKAEMKTVTTYGFFTECPPESGSFVLQVNGSPVTRAAEGVKVGLIASPSIGYEIGSVTVVTCDKNGSTKWPYGTPVTVKNGETFVMPNSFVKVIVEFAPCTSKIDILPSSYGTITTNVGGFGETGKTVTLYEVPSEPGKYAPGLPTVTRTLDGTYIKVSFKGKLWNNASVYEFVMPGGGATVTPAFVARKKVPTTIDNIFWGGAKLNTASHANYVEIVEVNGEAPKTTDYYVGDTLKLAARTDEGYSLVKYEVWVDGTQNAALTDNLNSTQTIIVPDCTKLEIKVVFDTVSVNVPEIYEKNYWMWWFAADNYNKSVNSYKVGNEAAMFFTGNGGYNVSDIASIKVYNDKNELIGQYNNGTVTAYGFNGFKKLEQSLIPNTYANGVMGFSFAMPAGGVNVEVSMKSMTRTLTLANTFTMTAGGTTYTAEDMANLLRAHNGGTYNQTLAVGFERKIDRGVGINIEMVGGNKYNIILDEIWYVKAGTTDEHYVKAENGVAKFGMPDYNVEITRATGHMAGIDVSSIARELSHVGIDFYSTFDAKTSSYSIGSKVLFKVWADNEYRITYGPKLINTSNGNDISSLLTDEGGNYWSFTLTNDLKGNVKIVCKAEKPGPKTVTISTDVSAYYGAINYKSGSENVNYDGAVTLQAHAGADVKFTLTNDAVKAAYKKIKVDGKEYNFNYGEAVFKMPDHDVTVEFLPSVSAGSSQPINPGTSQTTNPGSTEPIPPEGSDVGWG